MTARWKRLVSGSMLTMLVLAGTACEGEVGEGEVIEEEAIEEEEAGE